MSFNRENVTWQSADGTWNIGFWSVIWTDPEGDPEWDVEYGNDFEWVTTGHATEDNAWDRWDGANPGGTCVYEYNEETATECDRFDALAERFNRRKVQSQ